jgi:hypothetical protein
MIQEIEDWIYENYGVQVPKLDIAMALIIAGGLLVLIFSLINPLWS